MENIIEELIKIDEEAQKITLDVEEKKKNLDKDIEEASKKIRSNVQKETNARLEKLYMEIQAAIEKKTNETRFEAKQALDELIKLYEDNHQSWEDEIFNNMIYRRM